ncbi:MAG: SRPBCC family protein [Candidatus Promineifilaceae bacterium]|nr:SRPBCC family protein [Candidatus Promineifilaceae bacterium]
MITVNISIDINRSPEEVFAFLSDFENNPQWQNGMKVCTWTSAPPLRIGSTYEQEASFLGRSIFSHFEVIAYEPGQLVQATSPTGTFPITFTRSVAPSGSGTRVKALIEGDASGVFKLAEPLMAPLVRKSIAADYARLKELLERT